MKSFIFLCLLSLISVGTFACKPKQSASQSEAVKVGAAAPGFTLNSVDGKKVSLSDFKGKVVLLDFWATWCPPCRMSTPALAALSEKMKGKNFTVVGISLDEDFAAVPPYIQKEKVTHPVLYAGDSDVAELYQIRAIPSFYLLDKNGVVQKQFSGFYPGMEKEWEKEITQLLAQP